MTTPPSPAPTRPRVKTTPLAGAFARNLARAWLWFFGWKVEGSLPPGIKAVAIAYPHTTNWDLPFMLAVAYRLGVRPSWLGKRQLFRAPFGGFMRWLGGIPVDRSARTNMVAQVVERFADVDRLFLVIPPSATRHKAAHWKSGFYHIARGAGVPILCTFLDYTRKIGGIGPAIVPGDDLRADMDVIRAFYEGVEGLYPQNHTPIYLPEEAPPPVRAAGGSARPGG
jgi:1-acyl-sn-glycerol-3-phosphate acyltransferase